MGKIKNWFKSVGAKLKNPKKGKQGKAFVRVVQFFAIILALTIFARGAASVTMPEVTVATLQSQNIRDDRQYSGVIKSTNEQEIELPVGVKVDRVYAQTGENVRQDEPLVSFDADLIQEELLRQNSTLLGLQQELQNLQDSTGVDDSAVKAAEKMRDQAQLAVNEAAAKKDAALAELNNANAQVTAAQNALAEVNLTDYRVRRVGELTAEYAAVLTAATQAEAEAESAYTTAAEQLHDIEDSSMPLPLGVDDPQYIAAKQAMEDALAAWENAKTALQQAQANSDGADAVANGTVDAEIAAAQAAVTEAQNALPLLTETFNQANMSLEQASENLTSAQEAVDKAEEEYNEAQSDSVLAERIRQNNIRLKNKEIEEQNKTIAELQTLASTEAIIYAPADGIVSQVTVSRGAITTETDFVSISTGSEGYLVEFMVSPQQARDIRMGSTVSVMPQGYTWGSSAQVTSRGAPDDSGSIPMRAQLNDTSWADGDAVNVSVTISEQQYWSCVPISAVRPDENGYYVLVLSEENTILGTQTVARKMPVTILAQNNEYAAIDGIYDYEAYIVVSGSKPVSDGDTVRIAEDNVL